MKSIEERLEADGFAGVEPVLFFGPTRANGLFSNFYRASIYLPHPFTGEGTRYKTGEHRFQAMKAKTIDDHDYVRTAHDPFQAKERGGPIGIELRDGWGNNYGDLCWYVMLEVVTAKITQDMNVYHALMRTGGRPIYEDSPTDDIWGVRRGDVYKGKNLLGRCWMEARALLIDEDLLR